MAAMVLPGKAGTTECLERTYGLYTILERWCLKLETLAVRVRSAFKSKVSGTGKYARRGNLP